MALSEETEAVIAKYIPAEVRHPGISDEVFRDVVTATYDCFLIDGVMPDVPRLAAYTKRRASKISEVLATDAYKLACQERGLIFETTNGLSAEQSYCISILTNPAVRGGLEVRLKRAGVPYSRYRAWMKQPLFRNYLNQVAENALSENQGNVLTQLTHKAASGDMNAIKFFLEVTGRHDPRREAEINVQATLMRFIEIVTKHVKDPAVLQAMAAEFQMLGIGTGGTASQAPVTTVQGEVLGRAETPIFDFEAE